MAKLVLILLLVLGVSHTSSVETSGTADGMEEWGYTDVREGAHLFWWLYLKEVKNLETAPIVLWLQGGPGASGVGFGNFQEIGPLTVSLEKRENSWLEVAHLLFVDLPVGAGYSYVDNSTLRCATDKQVVDDLVTFLGVFFENHDDLRKAPFFIVAESYGGKFASGAGVAIQKNLKNLNFNFQGVALGDTWISPMDFLYAWGPMLKTFSLVDEADQALVDSYAFLAASEMEKGNYVNATYLWADMEEAILSVADNVDFYNILNHDSEDEELLKSKAENILGARYLRKTGSPSLKALMNGHIREKLKIIPDHVEWDESSGAVFNEMASDFMLPRIDQVDEMLALGLQVFIYSGQLDLICCTTGTEAWVQKLKWPGLVQFNQTKRKHLSCDATRTSAFLKQYENLTFFWIMNAGHMVPSDNSCMALKMLKMITARVKPNDSDYIATEAIDQMKELI